MVSLALFWAYVEKGVGFQVACLPPVARLIDQCFVEPVLTNLRSFSSSLFIKKGNGSTHSGDATESEPKEAGELFWTELQLKNASRCGSAVDLVSNGEEV